MSIRIALNDGKTRHSGQLHRSTGASQAAAVSIMGRCIPTLREKVAVIQENERRGQRSGRSGTARWITETATVSTWPVNLLARRAGALAAAQALGGMLRNGPGDPSGHSVTRAEADAATAKAAAAVQVLYRSSLLFAPAVARQGSPSAGALANAVVLGGEARAELLAPTSAVSDAGGASASDPVYVRDRMAQMRTAAEDLLIQRAPAVVAAEGERRFSELLAAARTSVVTMLNTVFDGVRSGADPAALAVVPQVLRLELSGGSVLGRTSALLAAAGDEGLLAARESARTDENTTWARYAARRWLPSRGTRIAVYALLVLSAAAAVALALTWRTESLYGAVPVAIGMAWLAVISAQSDSARRRWMRAFEGYWLRSLDVLCADAARDGVAAVSGTLNSAYEEIRRDAEYTGSIPASAHEALEAVRRSADEAEKYRQLELQAPGKRCVTLQAEDDMVQQAAARALPAVRQILVYAYIGGRITLCTQDVNGRNLVTLNAACSDSLVAAAADAATAGLATRVDALVGSRSDVEEWIADFVRSGETPGLELRDTGHADKRRPALVLVGLPDVDTSPLVEPLAHSGVGADRLFSTKIDGLMMTYALWEFDGPDDWSLWSSARMGALALEATEPIWTRRTDNVADLDQHALEVYALGLASGTVRRDGVRAAWKALRAVHEALGEEQWIDLAPADMPTRAFSVFAANRSLVSAVSGGTEAAMREYSGQTGEVAWAAALDRAFQVVQQLPAGPVRTGLANVLAARKRAVATIVSHAADPDTNR